MSTEASLLSPQAALIARKLKTASEKGLPDWVMPFVNEEHCVSRMKLVDGKNKKVAEDLNVPACAHRTEHRQCQQTMKAAMANQRSHAFPSAKTHRENKKRSEK